MSKLPLRERLLNAYAGGFAPSWIVERFGVSEPMFWSVLRRARLAGDPRATFADKKLANQRRRMAIRNRDVKNSGHAHLDVPDEFPELPPITAPILPFGGRLPESVEDVEWR